MNHFIVGNYVPGNSWVHRMLPISKLVLSFFLIVIALLANDWLDYLLLAAITWLAVLALRIPIYYVYRGIRPLLLIIVITTFLQILFSNGKVPLWQWGPFLITREGIVDGCFVFLRFSLVIVISTVLTLSTSPLEISNGFADLLSPLRFFKVPVGLVSLLLAISLRFISTLSNDFLTILKAQRARGVNLSKGSWLQRVHKLIDLLIPLLYRSFQHAQQLSDAMISRGYDYRKPRSRYHAYSWRIYDTLGWLLCILTGILVFYFRK